MRYIFFLMILIILGCNEDQPKELTGDPFATDIDTLPFGAPQALRVIPGTSWILETIDSLNLYEQMMLSQNGTTGRESRFTSNTYAQWLFSLASDSLSLSGTNMFLYAEDFGAVGDGTSDNTSEIQMALDSAETLGGGTVVLPRGIVLVSNDSSAHANAMLLIPEGVNLIGYGRDNTTLTTQASKRGDNGIFIVPKGYDTATVYNAAGNFIISDFTITEGAITPNKTNGDLIALAHSENVIVERMSFGNHDQHAVDVHGSRNITIRDCIANNAVVASSACATLQIEAASSGGVWGANADGTGSKDVFIYDNDIVNLGAANTIHVFHGTNGSSQVFSNIQIRNNRISGAYAATQDVVGTDDNVWANVTGFLVSENYIVGNHQDARLINLYDNLATASHENFTIINNHLSGSGRGGIYMGGDGTGIAPTKNIIISGNTIDINSGTSTLARYAIQMYGSKGVIISNNVIEYLGATIPTTSGIVTIQSATNVIFSNNRIDHNFSNAAAGSGVVFISDPATTSVTIEGQNNSINRSGTLGGASFATQIKRSSLGIDDIVTINDPIDPQYITGASTVNINLNQSGSAVASLDYSGLAAESMINFYNPKIGGQYKILLTGASGDSLVWPLNVITYKGDTLNGRISNSAIYKLYYDGTNYITEDTLFASYDPTALTPLLLDTYTGAVAVYSLRHLYATWVDSTIITVRRSSDNAEQSFTSTQISDGTLTTFTGANDGFITTIRDQSGSSYDVTQSVSANQPQIVASGALVTKNSLPAVQFDGTNDGLTYVGNIFSSSSAGTAFSLVSFTNATTASREVVFGLQDVTGSAYDFLIARQADDEKIEFYVEGDFRDNTAGTGITDVNSHRITLIYSNTVVRSQYIDGVLDMNYGGASVGILDDGTDFFIGQQIGGSNYFPGTFQELIIFDSNESANRVAIEGNIGTYYGL